MMNEFDFEPQTPGPRAPSPVSGTGKAFSIVSFVCGIVSLCSLFAGIPFAITGLVFAAQSKKRCGCDLPRNRKGRIMSIIGLVLSILWLIAYIALLVWLFSSDAIRSEWVTEPPHSYFFG